MGVLELLSTLNQECNFTESIKESKYCESIHNKPNKPNKPNNQQNQNNHQNKKNQYFPSIVECILSEYDPLFSTIPDNERKLYLKQRVLEICTLLDEEKNKYYDSYHLNEKIMKPKLIQQSLQLSLLKKTTVSSLYYLNEFYKKHFVLIEHSKYYETSLKDFPKDFILKQGNKYSFNSLNPLNDSYQQSLDQLPIDSDLKKSKLIDMYHKHLESIGKYKISDLQTIADELKISSKINQTNKNKTKQNLYDEINAFHYNL